MIGFDAASLLLQWATGGLAFLWVTTRHQQVSLGFGWLMRGIYGSMALGAAYIGAFVIEPLLVRDVAALGVGLVALGALAWSIARRAGGPTGLPRHLDAVAPVIGAVGVVASAFDAGGPTWLAVARFVVGAAFLGAVTDAMLLGHWYLVQPGLSRAPLHELLLVATVLWLPEVVVLLLPTGMVSVLNGTIDDGYGGMLGWFWVMSAVTTIALLVVTRLALREKQYSAVMAATGLLYLAILTAAGTDLVARALLA
jgi:hypothetical protein